jgi:hypothetical protein
MAMADACELEFFAADDGTKPVLAWIKNDLTAASIVTSAALRALPTQLDLFTAVVGGLGVGGIVGGAVALLLDKDLAQGGILGGVLGMILGALLAILQSSGLYS